ncbi:hypothetical protein MBLNU230_g3003t1 [Neophaeotheca triangularis]
MSRESPINPDFEHLTIRSRPEPTKLTSQTAAGRTNSEEPEEDDDPIVAEYDIYLTPELAEEIYLLQYPNRSANQPYNSRSGVTPGDMRIKPKSGYIEMELNQNINKNFDLAKAIKWQDSLAVVEASTGKASFGAASGFPDARTKVPRNKPIAPKDEADLEARARNLISNQPRSSYEDQLMRKQVLGGHVHKHANQTNEPNYFLGAFRGNELHLTSVTGTAQMRPQHHHLDAEDLRKKAAARQAAADPDAAPVERSILPSFKTEGEASSTLNKGGALKPDEELRAGLKAAEEEAWVPVEYIDEAQEEAFEAFYDKMFVKDVAGATEWKSSMDAWDYLDGISKPRKGTRRRRSRAKAKSGEELEESEDGEGEAGEEGGGGEAAATAAAGAVASGAGAEAAAGEAAGEGEDVAMGGT